MNQEKLQLELQNINFIGQINQKKNMGGLMLDGYLLEMIKLEDSVFLIGQCNVLTGAIKNQRMAGMQIKNIQITGPKNIPI